MDGKKLLIQMEISKPALPKALHEGLKGTDVFLQSAHFCRWAWSGHVHVEESCLHVCAILYISVFLFFSNCTYILCVAPRYYRRACCGHVQGHVEGSGLCQLTNWAFHSQSPAGQAFTPSDEIFSHGTLWTYWNMRTATKTFKTVSWHQNCPTWTMKLPIR